MKLYIKNKVWSLRGSSSVKDEGGNDVFIVKGKFLSITHVKRIKDTSGNMLYKVRNKFVNLFSRSAYINDGDGSRVAKVERKFGFKNRIIVHGYKDEIAVEGDFLSWTLDIYRNGDKIGEIRREFNLFDSFVLETSTEDDAAFMVALVIAIDNIFDSRSKDNSIFS